MNFDPFDEYGDNELWYALEEASLITSHADVLRGSSACEATSLTAMVQKLSWKLSEKVREGGISFSILEKDNFYVWPAHCWRKAGLLSWMKQQQTSITKQIELFKKPYEQSSNRVRLSRSLTDLKHYHIDYDRVLILDDGGILGFDRPENLLEKQSYLF